MALVRSTYRGHFSWNNGAPTLASGDGLAAPSSPGTGQIQLAFSAAAPIVGATSVIGNAGGAGARVVPLNTTGLVQIQDASGSPVNFSITTGFAFLLIGVTEDM